jgi:hypothetical protein
VITLPLDIPAAAKPGESFQIDLRDIELSDAGGGALPQHQGVPGKLTVSSGARADGLLSINDVSGRAGSTVILQVLADENVKDVTGVSLNLDFNTSTPAGAPPLAVTGRDGVKAGELLKGGLAAANLETDGKILVGIAGTEPVSGPGVVAEITFRIPGNAAARTTYAVNLSAVVAVGQQDIPIEAVGGTITVLAARMKGDLNGDDRISIVDATLALRAALNLVTLDEEQLYAADLNDDGRIAIAEVTRILRAALGLDRLEE